MTRADRWPQPILQVVRLKPGETRQIKKTAQGVWKRKRQPSRGKEGCRIRGSLSPSRMGLGGERRPRGRPPFPLSDQPERSGPGGRPGDVGWSCRTRVRITGVPQDRVGGSPGEARPPRPEAFTGASPTLVEKSNCGASRARGRAALLVPGAQPAIE